MSAGYISTFICTQCHKDFRRGTAALQYTQHFCSNVCRLAYKADFPARFWEKVSIGSFRDCWPWTGCLQGQGYGQINTKNKRLLAHRVSFEFVWGPLSAGLFALHRCDNPPCCNPWHLFQGNAKDNAQDMMQKGRRSYDSMPHGEKIHNAKFTIDDVLNIRFFYDVQKKSRREIAQQFNVTYQAIDHIVKRRLWKHVH